MTSPSTDKSNAKVDDGFILDDEFIRDWLRRLTQYNVRLTRLEGQQLCASHIALQNAFSSAQSSLAEKVLAECEAVARESYRDAGVTVDTVARRLRELFTRLNIKLELLTERSYPTVAETPSGKSGQVLAPKIQLTLALSMSENY